MMILERWRRYKLLGIKDVKTDDRAKIVCVKQILFRVKSLQNCTLFWIELNWIMLRFCPLWWHFFAYFGTLCYFLAFFGTNWVFWAFYAVLSQIRVVVTYVFFCFVSNHACVTKLSFCMPMMDTGSRNVEYHLVEKSLGLRYIKVNRRDIEGQNKSKIVGRTKNLI